MHIDVSCFPLAILLLLSLQVHCGGLEQKYHVASRKQFYIAGNS